MNNCCHGKDHSSDATSEKSGEEAQSYACPMHPEVTSDHPGRCPKCGMDLVQVKISSNNQSEH